MDEAAGNVVGGDERRAIAERDGVAHTPDHDSALLLVFRQEVHPVGRDDLGSVQSQSASN